MEASPAHADVQHAAARIVAARSAWRQPWSVAVELVGLP
jgi:hypothetical protein